MKKLLLLTLLTLISAISFAGIRDQIDITFNSSDNNTITVHYTCQYLKTVIHHTESSQQTDFDDMNGYLDNRYLTVGDVTSEVRGDLIYDVDFKQLYSHITRCLRDFNIPYTTEWIEWDAEGKASNYDHRSDADVIFYEGRNVSNHYLHAIYGVSIKKSLIKEYKIY